MHGGSLDGSVRARTGERAPDGQTSRVLALGRAAPRTRNRVLPRGARRLSRADAEAARRRHVAEGTPVMIESFEENEFVKQLTAAECIIRVLDWAHVGRRGGAAGAWIGRDS